MTELYAIKFTNPAKADLKRVDRVIARRVKAKLGRLAKEVNLIDHYALSGNWAGYFRIRVGDYRVVYTLDHSAHVIVIERIGHRGTIYKE